MMTMTKYEIRLLNKRYIDPITGCWIWLGATNNAGYGKMKFEAKYVDVHRVSAAIFLYFDLKSGLQVNHRCDNKSCFNPKHLFIGSQVDNIRDRNSKGRHIVAEKCKNSHNMSEDNILKLGFIRTCKLCYVDKRLI